MFIIAVLSSARMKNSISSLKVFTFYRIWYRGLLLLKRNKLHSNVTSKFFFCIQAKKLFKRFFIKSRNLRIPRLFPGRRHLFLPVTVLSLSQQFHYRSKRYRLFKRLFKYRYKQMRRFFRPIRFFKRRGFFKPFFFVIFKYLVTRGHFFGSLLLRLVFNRAVNFFRLNFTRILLYRRGKWSLFSGRQQLFRVFSKTYHTYNHLRLFTRFSSFRRLNLFSSLPRLHPGRLSKDLRLVDGAFSDLSKFLSRTLGNFPAINEDLLNRICYGLQFNTTSRQPLPVDNFLIGVLGKPSKFKHFMGSRRLLFNLFFLVKKSFFNSQLRSLFSFCGKLGYSNPKCLYISDSFIFRKMSSNILNTGSGYAFSKWQKGTFTNRYFFFFWVNFAYSKVSLASNLSVFNLVPFYSVNNDTSSLSRIARNLVYFSPFSFLRDCNPDILFFNNLTDNLAAFDESLKNGYSSLCFNFSAIVSNSLFTLIGNSFWPLFQLLFFYLLIFSIQMGKEEFRNLAVKFLFTKFVNGSAFFLKIYGKCEKFFFRAYKGVLIFFSHYFFSFLDPKKINKEIFFYSNQNKLELFFFFCWNYRVIELSPLFSVFDIKLIVLKFLKRYRVFFPEIKKLFSKPCPQLEDLRVFIKNTGKAFFSTTKSNIFSSFFIVSDLFNFSSGVNFFGLRYFLSHFMLSLVDPAFLARLQLVFLLISFFFQSLNSLLVERIAFSSLLFVDFNSSLVWGPRLGYSHSNSGQGLPQKKLPVMVVPKQLNFTNRDFSKKVWESFHFRKSYYFRSKYNKFGQKGGSRKDFRLTNLIFPPL